MRCRGYACERCGEPVYVDESFLKLMDDGHCHLRCEHRPEPRPEWMRAVGKLDRDKLKERGYDHFGD